MPRWLLHLLVLAALIALLLGVYSLYLRPDFLLSLANRLWACF